MCGITGYAKGTQPEDNAVEEATKMLRRLVYRGYDSWGYATDNNYTYKKVGEVPEQFDLPELSTISHAQACIAHTRWATHGKVTEENAHPHTSCETSMEEGVTPRYAVVHNGVIENYEHFKNKLEDHTFTSQTDTEVIPHWVEDQVNKGRTTSEAIHLFQEEAEGNYAFLLLDRKTGNIHAVKQGSPLVFAYPTNEDGVIEHPKGAYFASDLYAISDKCEEAFFMKDGDHIMSRGSNLALHRPEEGWLEGFPVDEWKSFEWTEEEPELGEKHKYWMEKEIKEQPEALKRLRESLKNEQREDFLNFKSRIEDDYDDIVFVASGTSYHATLLGVYYMKGNAQTIIASEFEDYNRVDSNTLVIAVSQSGETRDVLNAMEQARKAGATIGCLVNVPHSTIQRKADFGLEIKAHQENCVAATKTFANQVYALMHLARLDNIDEIPERLEENINTISQAAYMDAEQFYEKGHEDIYIIGNSSTYPVAREIALKLKEIPYIHAEGMMAGELKHGTLALIEEDTPVIALDDGTGRIETNVEEVVARGANVKTLSNTYGDEEAFVFQATTYGFFLALYWAHRKGLPVDRPRNLAKSVTVK